MSSTRICKPRFLSHMASCDVASKGQANRARHDIDTHYEPSFLEVTGIL